MQIQDINSKKLKIVVNACFLKQANSNDLKNKES